MALRLTRFCKKTQLDAQLILGIFRQPLCVSGVSRPIIRRYNHISITIGTFIIVPVDIGEVETISVAASATPVAAGTPDYDFVVTVLLLLHQ